jgi:hypothetical protein
MVYVHAIWKTKYERGIEVPRHKSLQLIHWPIQEGRHESYLLGGENIKLECIPKCVEKAHDTIMLRKSLYDIIIK